VGTRPPSAEELDQRDDDRVDLLAGRAAGDPDPDRSAVALALRDLREDEALQLIEDLGIPEEGRDVDEQVLEEGP
jgi:hypothetical protein